MVGRIRSLTPGFLQHNANREKPIAALYAASLPQSLSEKGSWLIPHVAFDRRNV